MDSAPGRSAGLVDNLELQKGCYEAPVAPSISKAMSSSGETNTLAAAKSGVSNRPAFQSMQPTDPKLKSQPMNRVLPSARLGVGASAEPQRNNDIPVSKGGEEPPVKDALVHTRVLDHAISRLALSGSVGDGVAGFQSSDIKKKDCESKHAVSATHKLKADNALVPQRSHTIHDLSGGIVGGQGVSVAVDYLHHASEDRTATDLADRVLSRFRRRWAGSWRSSDDGLEERLEEQLIEAIVRSPDPHRRFLPRGQLLRLVTQKAVESELKRYEYSLRKRLRIWRPPAGPAADIRTEAQTICDGIEYARSASGTEDEKRSRDAQKPEETSYRKIFTILLLIDRPSRIRSFIEEGVSDADLPLVKMPRTNRLQGCLELRRRNSRTPLLCFKKWRDSTVARFEQHQWTVLAPFFAKSNGKDNSHLELEPEEILPFTSWTVAADPGGFGQVYRVEIHPDHHAFNTAKASGNVFAIKTLYSSNKDAFTQEVGILKNLSSESHAHPHLITLLSTYEQVGKYYIIFPWAEADLLGYWKHKNPEPSNDREMALWLAEQCQGLADGLSTIHHYKTFSGTSLPYDKTRPRADSKEVELATQTGETSGTGAVRLLFGRHGDIKANNILWFPDPGSKGGHGILKITDFGIAHFSTENTVSARDRGLVANSPTYRPPECDLPNGKLSMSCDIWALGCVYLEFITWFFGGWKHLEEFGSRRLAIDHNWGGIRCDPFFVIGKDEKSGEFSAEVKDCVTQLMDELRSTDACTDFFREFLNMIQNEMLIVEPSNPGHKTVGRKSSGTIARTLGSMKINCIRNPDYVARSTSLPGD